MPWLEIAAMVFSIVANDQNCFLNLTFFNIYYVYGERLEDVKGMCIGMYIGDFYTFYMNRYVVEIQHKFNLISFIDLNYLQK